MKLTLMLFVPNVQIYGKDGIVSMINTVRSPIFISGMAIRVFLILSVSPATISEWYVPFLTNSIDVTSFDPWSTWMNAGGAAEAFPYGYMMWLTFYPFVQLASLLGLPIEIGYTLCILIADILLFWILQKLLPGRNRLLLLAYWCSPIVILASYGLGVNDVVPALYLTLAILFLGRNNIYLAGGFVAAAISAKLSMVIAAPFFIIYLYNNKSLRQFLVRFFVAFSVIFAALGIPFLHSTSAVEMLLGNPELSKFLSLDISLTEKSRIYVVPIAYIVGLYLVWRIRRQNFELFMAINGIAFLLIVITTPSAAGWFIWSIPFLSFYQALSGRIAIIGVSLLSMIFMLMTLTANPLQLMSGGLFKIVDALPSSIGYEFFTITTHTTMVAVGFLLAIRMWHETVTRNDFYRLSRKPFVIGIAGDSGSGKDTYSNSLTDLFGGHSVATISGDDYHLWDRQKPMWQMMTHLNPMANDLEGFSQDLVALTDGKTIRSRCYDHSTGKMTKARSMGSNDFIIASGLHALYLPLLRECYNLKVYLDIDEGLRRYFKINRDVISRGHSIENVIKTFDKREPDAKKFVRTQRRHADLRLALQPIHSRMLTNTDARENLRLKLVVTQNNGLNEINLNKTLVGFCGLHVDVVVSEDGAEVQTSIEGDLSAADVALAAKIVFPKVFEFLDIKPIWHDGITGIIQLVSLSHINQLMTKRFIE
ncbi:hypothetical protein OAM99_04800 [Planktomarina sp.]|nr:hypothetical protein [Planktomarina sp.]